MKLLKPLLLTFLSLSLAASHDYSFDWPNLAADSFRLPPKYISIQTTSFFCKWVEENKSRFATLLKENESISGEWLVMAHGTRYDLPHEPFVPFDLIIGSKRNAYKEFEKRVNQLDFILPHLLHVCGSYPIKETIKAIKTSGHGALDEVEGAIGRIERNEKIDFLCKYVHQHKQDGKYFAEVAGKGEV